MATHIIAKNQWETREYNTYAKASNALGISEYRIKTAVEKNLPRIDNKGQVWNFSTMQDNTRYILIPVVTDDQNTGKKPMHGEILFNGIDDICTFCDLTEKQLEHYIESGKVYKGIPKKEYFIDELFE